ncbi:MAG: hypothetical protein COW70_07615 [Hydrogenophilales bacterium CG18_big_fil_WC_8_21_14_2_50_58_12]|nr:MAG: hypothetical protein COW70_07615 [Hydrogenophilales bacterium CG18_big_fil_WC_8_21_14_2_50_58_12]
MSAALSAAWKSTATIRRITACGLIRPTVFLLYARFGGIDIPILAAACEPLLELSPLRKTA